jgi:uroporphyrinogen decarboxylase
MISYTGKNRQSINYLKTIYFDHPEWTICNVSLMPATWMKYRGDLEEIVLAHPRLFPGYRRGDVDFDFTRLPNRLYELGYFTDCWGTVWENIERGLDSHPIGFPLEDWAALESYTPPDPLTEDSFGPRDWAAVRRSLAEARARGDIAAAGGLQHGFMYMRLFYLRRFENLMLDMATDEPRLQAVIQMVEDYNSAVIRKTLEFGPEMMGFGDDLGLQRILPMGPALWRKYIKPSYMRMFAPCRAADIPIRLHTDGHIVEIIPDLIEAGVTLLNPQIRANGLAGLVKMAKGHVALHQDLDRQLFPFATPSEIEDHIGEVFEALYLPEGGLMLHAECEPDVPLENVEVICRTLEKICKPPLLA